MTDETRSHATEWLRGYHGSIDATALLLAHEAGQRLANLPQTPTDHTDLDRVAGLIREGIAGEADLDSIRVPVADLRVVLVALEASRPLTPSDNKFREAYESAVESCRLAAEWFDEYNGQEIGASEWFKLENAVISRSEVSQPSDRTNALEDAHARFHDQPGNMIGRDECGWVGCEFWDAAELAAAALEASRPLTPSAALAQIEALSERDFIDAGHGSCLADSACALCEALEAARVELSSRPALTPETGDVREALLTLLELTCPWPLHALSPQDIADAILARFHVTSKGTPEPDEGNR